MFRVFQKIEKGVKFKELQGGTYMLKGVNETFCLYICLKQLLAKICIKVL